MKLKSALILFLVLFFFSAKNVFATISSVISNPVVDSNDEITIDVNITGLISSSCPNTQCFLQGMLTQSINPQYLGFTQNNNSQWYEYNGSPDTSYIQSTFFSFTPNSGSWSGQLKVKN